MISGIVALTMMVIGCGAGLLMMTGCGTSNGGSAAEVKPEGQNLAANAKVDKANVEYVNRFDETSDRPEDKEQA